jgi:hypothetical protein
MSLLLFSISDEIREVADKAYGTEDRTVPGGWNGMVGELIRRVSGNGNYILKSSNSNFHHYNNNM